ncbi:MULTISPECIES: hypothetical protein [Rhodopseudomonas]|uniref:Uncharacterized protein n=1 Tax=Rhodopseudomonas palustris TaxID=1076 RepID=A0A0D7EDY1_RHOPL|nr:MULTISPECIES: hypothetical protein [Rhodopseudomonas]KIZ38953.1 hypothetical protein OO17_21930 [Rhodopseudomonas palustris]MDF3811821.1 hypothetical protein [Rhodopseudomonas sp. BAL398]WOK20290.1 hypothetical protein RBJ75_12540 [Rhodopseudomonas sp. BAL398]
MSESEAAELVWQSLNRTENVEPQTALPILKGLTRLVKGDGRDHPLEVHEARSSAFLAICEFAKALHRGQPAERLRDSAIIATEKWRALA